MINFLLFMLIQDPKWGAETGEGVAVGAAQSAMGLSRRRNWEPSKNYIQMRTFYTFTLYNLASTPAYGRMYQYQLKKDAVTRSINVITTTADGNVATQLPHNATPGGSFTVSTVAGSRAAQYFMPQGNTVGTVSTAADMFDGYFRIRTVGVGTAAATSLDDVRNYGAHELYYPFIPMNRRMLCAAGPPHVGWHDFDTANSGPMTSIYQSAAADYQTSADDFIVGTGSQISTVSRTTAYTAEALYKQVGYNDHKNWFMKRFLRIRSRRVNLPPATSTRLKYSHRTKWVPLMSQNTLFARSYWSTDATFGQPSNDAFPGFYPQTYTNITDSDPNLFARNNGYLVSTWYTFQCRGPLVTLSTATTNPQGLYGFCQVLIKRDTLRQIRLKQFPRTVKRRTLHFNLNASTGGTAFGNLRYVNPSSAPQQAAPVYAPA